MPVALVITAVGNTTANRVLIGANAVATLVRFLLLRTWVHRDPLAVASSMATTAGATSSTGD